MTDLSLDDALTNIYTSINGDNEDIDLHIANLKKTLGDKKDVDFDPSRMTYSNRESRKRMQAYFKKRGLLVSFTK